MAANQSAASAQAASADWVDVDFSEDFRSSFLDLGPAQPRSGEDEHRRRQRGSDAVGEDGAEERKEAPEDAQPRGGGWLQRLVQWMHRKAEESPALFYLAAGVVAATSVILVLRQRRVAAGRS